MKPKIIFTLYFILETKYKLLIFIDFLFYTIEIYI